MKRRSVTRITSKCGVQAIKLALHTRRVLPITQNFLSPASLEAAENAEKEKGYLESK
jgi:hypothetical protein